jgi:hypothetical protein
VREVWLPLTGKQCFVEGWSSIGYQGIDPESYEGDVGLRLDRYIVVDCDSPQAKEAWLKHIDQPMEHTWVRATPKGWHFFYRRTPESYGVKLGKIQGVHELIDLKGGMGHQVGFRGDGRWDLTSSVTMMSFDPEWVPAADQREWAGEEWSEMPEGMGDNSMIAFAGTFRRWGMDEATIAACLQGVNQVTMTTAPMPLKTIKRLARQAAKYNPEDPKTVLCPKCETEVEFR